MSAKLRKRGDLWTTTVYIRGKRKWLSAPTRAALEDKLSDAIRDRKKAEQHSVPADAFAAEWTTTYPRRKESTNIHNAERVKKFAEDFAGVLLCDVSRVDARAWALENRSRWKAVRAMFTDAVRDGLAESNPFLGLRLQDASRRKDRAGFEAPSEQDVQRLAECAAEVWGDWGLRVYGPMITAAAYTGLRPGELYALRWDDIDWTGQTVRVERQLNQKTNKVDTPKNGKARIVPLLPQAHRALFSVPRQREEVFFTPHGKRFSGRVQGYYFHPVRCAFGQPGMEYYVLRHAFGTMLANRGVAPYDIADAMGHQDGGKLAMATYIKVRSKESNARIQAAFGQRVISIAEPRQREAS